MLTVKLTRPIVYRAEKAMTTMRVISKNKLNVIFRFTFNLGTIICLVLMPLNCCNLPVFIGDIQHGGNLQ